MIVNKSGKLLIQPVNDLEEEEALARINAVIRLLQMSDVNDLDQDTLYFALETVKDLLPTEIQWKVPDQQ